MLMKKQYFIFNTIIMQQKEVFEIVRDLLIAKFPHCHRLYGLACFEPQCQVGDCRICYLRRPQFTVWEISCILPALEERFGKVCTINPPELYAVVKFFADS